MVQWLTLTYKAIGKLERLQMEVKEAHITTFCDVDKEECKDKEPLLCIRQSCTGKHCLSSTYSCNDTQPCQFDEDTNQWTVGTGSDIEICDIGVLTK